jgi:hypothetical protein
VGHVTQLCGGPGPTLLHKKCHHALHACADAAVGAQLRLKKCSTEPHSSKCNPQQEMHGGARMSKQSREEPVPVPCLDTCSEEHLLSYLNCESLLWLSLQTAELEGPVPSRRPPRAVSRARVAQKMVSGEGKRLTALVVCREQAGLRFP